MAGSIYVAKVSFHTTVDGKRVHVMAGTTVREGHPLLKGREHLFEPMVVRFDHSPKKVEQATASPGEKR